MSAIRRLPGGATLAPGEEVLAAAQLRYSTFAFYLSTHLVLTTRRLYAVRPNTLLGLIPVGTRRSNIPVESIAAIDAATRFDIFGVIFGLFGLPFGVLALGVPWIVWLGAILLFVSISAIVSSVRQAIEVINSGGGRVLFPVSFFERHRTLEFASDVSEALARQGGRAGAGLPVGTAAAIKGIEDRLRELDRLRASGLISEVEFSAKRADLLKGL